MDNMVQNPRYLALNTALMSLRGEDYELHIKGIDELRVRQDSVMAEACNASFQVHLQVAPDDFVNLYNVAQLLAGPVLACATNSPVLFGKRLWAETRIALFEQAVDTRRPGPHMRDRSARVTFGNDWVTTSITELYREDITRFRPLLAPDDYADPFGELADGRMPTLAGVAAAHRHGLALEPRLLRHHRRRAAPAHREPRAAVRADRRRRGRQRRAVARSDARRRTLAIRRSTGCCRSRSPARTSWPPPGRAWPPSRRGSTARSTRRARLALDVLLPLAAEGLASAGVADDDRTRYLDVIERRVRSGHTGLALAARLAQRDAQPGHGRAAPEQRDGGDAGPPARRLARRRVDPGRPRRGRRSGATTS